MASIATAAEAVARVAYLSSDVVLSVQPTKETDSVFSGTLNSLAQQQVKNVVSDAVPEVRPVRHNEDPLLSAYHPLQEGQTVSVTTTSTVLLAAIPHLYRLANYSIVIHVHLEPSQFADYSVISSIRQCGFSFLHSETLQEAHDIALTAHALALTSGKGVIHFFDLRNSAKDQPVVAEDAAFVKDILEVSPVRATHTPVDVPQTIYADSGRVAMVTDQGFGGPAISPGAAADTTAATDSALPIPSPKSAIHSVEPSSVGSSRRGSILESHVPSSSATTAETVTARPVDASDIFQIVSIIWDAFSARVGRNYHAIEYSGPQNAKLALFVFGSTGVFVDTLNDPTHKDEFKDVGIITARLYRPWIGSQILRAVPDSVERIAVLEQVRKTTKWGPSFLDLLSSMSQPPSSTRPTPTLVGYRLGYVEPATASQAVRGVIQNLTLETPIQSLDIGSETIPTPDAQLQQPSHENAYTKILNQLFSDRLYIANQLGSQDAGISATIAASPEYGFGSLLARKERRTNLKNDVEEAVRANGFKNETSKQLLSKWALNEANPAKANQIAPDVIAALTEDGSSPAEELLQSKELFFKEAQWLIGSDAWAYDLGNSGVHHVLASNKNVNMLIIDSQPYSQRTAADPTRRKKDIGLYAMNFGHAYVASVAVYSSYTQVLQAIAEAEQYNGPSVVVAYLPYHKESDSPLTVLQETKKAVEAGYWPLYRWNPENAEKGQPNFSLDSERIRRELEEFLRRDNQLTQLMGREPKFAASLSESYGSEVRALKKRAAKKAYDQLMEGLLGAPLTVLFASDNGNGENLARRLANRGKARGLKTMVMAMDDYPIEDLSREENIVLITSTAGQGELPQNGRGFWETVKDAGDLDLSSINYSVFGLGDSHYWPRKEDKLYYNKPAKDLDARLSFLGGKKLADVGLGDDQDPDGYQTGYQEWEPKIWKALGVDNVEGLPDEPAPLTNEDIKIQSNYLRGTIAEGLLDESTGALAESDLQLTKFHGTYMQDDRDLRDERKAQGLEPKYSFMIRCRLAGGVATPSQWLQMDEISSAQGNETMKLTTRQTFQFHGVVKGKLRAAMQAINRALMSTIAACGDVNRNVMCSSLPELSTYHREVHAVSKLISDHLLPATTAYHEIWLKDENDKKVQVAGDAVVDHEPLYGPTYLPRKFKITIAIPPHNDTDVYAHDIGLIAIKGSDGHLEGFNVLVGGGMGVTHNNKKTYPRTGSMLGYVPAKDTHIVCEKIMLVQRDHGDRKNRKHARMKYTVDDMGVDVFKGKVEDLLPEGLRFSEPRPFKFDSNVDTFGWIKDETGLNHFTCFIENGRVEDTSDFLMRTGLRELAKLNKGEFRLTGNQHVIISNIKDEDLPQVKALMAKYKLDNTSFSGLRLSSSACVAFPTCGLAMAESERYLPILITKIESYLEENGLSRESIVMRMTGCPNGCARPWLAEVAFVGKAYGAYNMYLGGGYHGQRLNKLYRSSIKEAEILDIMKTLLKRYALERQTDGEQPERFGDWCIRAGIIKETTEGKYFHEGVAEDEE
ncbi:sulfite reductase subunit beta [Nannizzia gypsea CBS 118893]|uniref:Sulfite reductase [NADPH] subunit beta n=1 Tax=Arthroderma gypseum (strain ATCC MYA-4604 / CBS 118893) TaxID=535722 RepID=E4UX63_ARTGP|nr:sulfite reductase subunit beta [Nannizzia gypsea CBS 118893]EFR01863.1 sulfite reductase subunit beta [Nannizzia gypsea CBS 118893]